MNKKVKMLVIQFITLCFLLFFLSLSQAEITLTVGNGSGFVGSDCCNPDYPSNNKVDISLDNPGDEDEVYAIQMDVCDVDDYYLTCTECETTGRTSDFICTANERDDGCCVVMLITIANDLITAGTGPIFTLLYNISGDAPKEECRDLELKDVVVTDVFHNPFDVTSVEGEFCFSSCTSSAQCVDELFCNGADSCNSGICVSSGDPCPPGTVCDEETDSCISTTTTSIAPTTTTALITTTTIPTMSTTTTTIVTSCQISISPISATLKSGTSLQFNAETTCDEEEVEGTYSWEIVPGSTIGSEIDGAGLFTAGDNTTDADVEETIEVTDSAHGNKSATATVTIQKKQDPVGCEVSISPLAATVLPGEMLTLVASTTGDCNTPQYEWSLNKAADDSSIEYEGDTCIYTAGANDGTEPLTDVISVADIVNEIDAEAVITITNIKSPCLMKEIYSENAEEVAFLRNFRDEVLSKSPSGGELIRLYYEWGPAIIKAMEEDEEYRREIKEVVNGVLMLIGGRRSNGNRYCDY